jgi:hypothetical protein
MRDFAIFIDCWGHKKFIKLSYDMKWFGGPHFELQTKAQNFEKSMQVISLQFLITTNPFPTL